MPDEPWALLFNSPPDWGGGGPGLLHPVLDGFKRYIIMITTRGCSMLRFWTRGSVAPMVEVTVIDYHFGPQYVGGINVCGEWDSISRSPHSQAQGVESTPAIHPPVAPHLETDPRIRFTWVFLGSLGWKLCGGTQWLFTCPGPLEHLVALDKSTLWHH